MLAIKIASSNQTAKNLEIVNIYRKHTYMHKLCKCGSAATAHQTRSKIIGLKVRVQQHAYKYRIP